MRHLRKLLILCALLAPLACTSPPEVREPLDVGNRRQLLLDESWFDHSEGVELTLHRPVPRESVIQCDRPWEGKRASTTPPSWRTATGFACGTGSPSGTLASILPATRC